MVEINQQVMKPTMLFAIAGGLIVLAMLMGRKSNGSGRTSVGWWIGLAVLLVVVSGFLGFSRLRISPVVEERHSGRSAIDRAMSEMRDKIESGVRAARDSMQKGLDEAQKSVEETEEAINTVTTKVTSSGMKNAKSGKASSSEITTTPLPTTKVEWTVEVTGADRSQRQQVVQERLEQRAAESVNRWVNERMPVKYYGFHFITPAWLVDHGAFPNAIEYEKESLDRANTDQKDVLIGGALKVVLPPKLQQTLLDMGYRELESQLQNEKVEIQGVMFVILLGITGFVGILALVKTLVSRRMRLG